ncbi:hypothetical protein IAU60_000103 [Kwoniella sp. DSM 27419]
MARGIACGSFLLFAAFALLLVSTLSAPVFRQISFLNVEAAGRRLAFGVFGYCERASAAGRWVCSDRSLGYDVASLSGEFSNINYNNGHLETLTKALILHPIATGLAFISFVIALLSDHLGFIFAALIALLAFIVSLVAMVIDFALFGIVRNHVRSEFGNVATAHFENAIWLTLAATVILFFSTFIVCFETCTARRRDRRRDREASGGYASGGYVGNQAPMMAEPTPYQKRHFWQRNRY